MINNQPINALQYGAQQYYAQEYDAQIMASLGWFSLHSVFENSLNLVLSSPINRNWSDRPLLLTLTHQDTDLQPYLMVLRKADFLMCKDLITRHMNVGYMGAALIRNTPEALSSTFLHISLAESKRWHATELVPQTFSALQQTTVANFLRERIARIQQAIWHHAHQHIAELFHRYQTTDDIGALEAMLGMGIGLTPSGDDFLMGLFAAWHANHRLKKTDLMCYLVGKSHRATTTISQHFLQNAADGRFNQALIEFNQLGSRANTEQILHQLMKVVQKGATSGLDTALGYFSGITGQTLY